jgi:hypothetical protein
MWIFDSEAINRHADSPGKWKLVVVMASGPEGLVLFRINSREGRRPGSVLVPRDPWHPFLDRDSYLFCGDPPVRLTDRQLEQAMSIQAIATRSGIVGRIHPSLLPQVRTAVRQSQQLVEEVRRHILATLPPQE